MAESKYWIDLLQPAEVAELIKIAIRSGRGMIHALNDARNKHTTAHPNKDLIKKREAKLVIQLTNSIVDYLEDIEKNLLL